MKECCVEDRLVRAARDVFERRRLCCPLPDEPDDGTTVTRQRLLTTARREFAVKGEAATVRDICTAAGTNVAAVNYHFGSKDGLLAAVLAQMLDELMVLYPMDGGVPEDAAPEERLYGFVFSFLCRVLLCCGDTADLALGRMLSRAFMLPLPQFEPRALKHRLDLTNWLVPVVCAIAGNSTIPTNVDVVEENTPVTRNIRSIVAQILLYDSNREMLLAHRGGRGFTLEEIAEIARHITLFSVGGIKLISE